MKTLADLFFPKVVDWQRPRITTLDLPVPKGVYYDKAAADRAVGFFSLLPIIDGPHAGEPGRPMRWVEFEVIRPLFGLKRADGTRLYREVYERVGRKNTKSTTCAGVAGVLTFADDEPGARVYAAAVDRDQAKEVFGTFSDSINASRELNPEANNRVKVLQRSVEYKPRNLPGAPARFYILSGETKNKDGLNASGGVLDELHAHVTPDLYELLNQATASRVQPIIFGITTAGTVTPDNIAMERDNYTERVAAGLVKDLAFLGLIYELDKDDAWDDPNVWIKANPGLGVSISMEFLMRECEKAKASPILQNAFRTKHVNQWQQQVIRAIDMDVWRASAGSVIEPDLKGESCWGGLYLSGSMGMAAWVLAFPHDKGVRFLPRFFAPAKLMENPSLAGLDKALIDVVPGEAIEYARIRERIVSDARKFDIQGINIRATDRGAQLGQELVEEFGEAHVIDFRNTFPGFKRGVEEFDRLLATQGLNHGGNPVLSLMADSYVVRRNTDGDVRPDPEQSQGPISGIVAMLMALDLVAASPGESEPLWGWG